MSRTPIARYAAGLTLRPGTSWSTLVPELRSIPVVLVQVVGGLACLALLQVRVAGLAATSAAFADAGGAALVGATLGVELLTYLAYLPLGAWIVTTVLRPARPELAWRRVLPVFAYSTLPLLAGWVVRTGVAWLRSGSAVASAGDFHHYVELLRQAVTLRADLGLLVPGGWTLLSLPAQALGFFWVWHAVVLWSGLVELTEGRRRWAWAALGTLFGLVLIATLVEGVAASQWRSFVVWTP